MKRRSFSIVWPSTAMRCFKAATWLSMVAALLGDPRKLSHKSRREREES
jgi:hypothetical protein